MKIIGQPSADKKPVFDRIREGGVAVHTRFIAEMFEPLWTAAVRYAVDPVGVVAQSIKETAGGTFPRKVQPWFFNTCGLRVRYIDNVVALLDRPNEPADREHPLTHQMFGSWDEGALAHVQHLRAYAGCPVPEDEVVDPRYRYVIGLHSLTDFEELGGKWAGSPTYGTELVAIARKLQGVF